MNDVYNPNVIEGNTQVQGGPRPSFQVPLVQPQMPPVQMNQNMPGMSNVVPEHQVVAPTPQVIPPIVNQGSAFNRNTFQGNVPYQNPQVNPVPSNTVPGGQVQQTQGGGLAMQPTAPQQVQPQQQQLPLPQQQQVQQQQQQVQPEYIIDANNYEGVDEGVLGELVTEAQESGVPVDRLDEYVATRLDAGGVDGFESGEDYAAYQEKFNEMRGALEAKYGDNAEQAFIQLRENIYKQGGEPLLRRFTTDVNMLTPELVFSYLDDGNTGNEFDQYLRGSQGQAGLTAPAGPAQAGTPPPPGGGAYHGPAVQDFGGGARSSAEVQNEINQMYAQINHPQNRGQSSQFGQKILQLTQERNGLAAQGL